MKLCVTCKKLLNERSFHKDKYEKDDLRIYCKDCIKIFNQRPEARKKRREYAQRPEVKAKNKKYRSTPEFKKRKNAQERERYTNPEVKKKKRKYRKEWYQRPGVKEHVKERTNKPEAIERRKKYFQRPDIKQRKRELERKRYRENIETKKRKKEWAKNHPEKTKKIWRKQKARRRSLGYIEIINNCFPDDVVIEYHHVFQGLPFVIPIPKITHNYIHGEASDNSHWKHNLDWVNKIYSIDIVELIFEGGKI